MPDFCVQFSPQQEELSAAISQQGAHFCVTIAAQAEEMEAGICLDPMSLSPPLSAGDETFDPCLCNYIRGPKGDPGDSSGVATPATRDKLGGIMVGDNLSITANGVLSVDTASAVEQDNTRPITSAAVYTEVGNINALLASI